MNRKGRARFHSFAGYAKRLMPVRVNVRLVSKMKRAGTCVQTDQDGCEYLVRVRSDREDANGKQALGILVHELAHVVAYELDGMGSECDHEEMFQAAKPIVMQWYVDWWRGLPLPTLEKE